jgi:hypothetical protein
MDKANRPPCPGPIELTAEEQALFGRLATDPEAGVPLMESLLERDAIPAIRWQYFAEPELNIGYSYSHMEQFERNGTRGEAIFRHPHFVPYLRYIVSGPDLPRRAIETFHEKVVSCYGVSSGDVPELWDLARQLTRQFGLDPHYACEEFHKLALECFGIMRDDEYDLAGYGGSARSIRDCVKKMRFRR